MLNYIFDKFIKNIGILMQMNDKNNENRKGTYNPRNKLNDLTGKEWIKFTKSWFIHNPPSRKADEMLHPAKFPETMIQEFIEFFTKKGQLVLDPFLGTGSALVAAFQANRSAIGIEVMEKYARIAQSRIDRLLNQKKLYEYVENPDEEKPFLKVIIGDSLNIVKIWKENNFPAVDYCITSPPYWNQLKRNTLRQRGRKYMGLDTEYGKNERNIGNIDDYRKFIDEQKKIFDEIYKVMKNNAYLTVITNNVYYNGRLYPLAYDTLISLSEKWVPKDEKIWLQNDKPLIPLGVNTAWVGNRHHQYCLIFRKEE
jgi:DNA modification methylase